MFIIIIKPAARGGGILGLLIAMYFMLQQGIMLVSPYEFNQIIWPLVVSILIAGASLGLVLFVFRDIIESMLIKLFLGMLLGGVLISFAGTIGMAFGFLDQDTSQVFGGLSMVYSIMAYFLSLAIYLIVVLAKSMIALIKDPHAEDKVSRGAKIAVIIATMVVIIGAFIFAFAPSPFLR